ncbi:unnamed protein product [Rotaria sordida]|uniref:Helicase C-terminal domain-containing protein n=1 Tax=Rotaria sordida TaxID=392033 RepID=A0A814SVH2_9BILA|nr:unnamed protein product [Rotaria sordida]
MFTVTITSVIERLARTYLRHRYRPAPIYIGSIDKSTECVEQIIISQLKQRQKDILVAIDDTGRGMHIKDVSFVLNCDIARTIQDCMHRIGRNDRTGKAIVFFFKIQLYFYELKEVILKLLNHLNAYHKLVSIYFFN